MAEGQEEVNKGDMEGRKECQKEGMMARRKKGGTEEKEGRKDG